MELQMPFWFFNRKNTDAVDPIAMRQALIDAASTGSSRTLRSVCRRYKSHIPGHLELLRTIPEGIQTDESSINRYFQSLIAVAQCLANECGSPELMNKLCVTPDDNPLTKWEHWFGELPERMRRLEFDSLVEEANVFIKKAKTLHGGNARQYEAFLHGRLGELLFHSGRVAAAIEPFGSAFDLCVASNDVQGQVTYLNNLLETHLYLDDGMGIQIADRLLNLKQQVGESCNDLQKRIRRIRIGEPLCRIVCVHGGLELELDEITHTGDGHFQFRFKRNRLPLMKATTLTGQGNVLASSGNFSDALEKYLEAGDTDPFNPDPVYQTGMCLLELGAYANAKKSFEEVEQLAPGWFRCRADAWLAAGLENGCITDDEFRLLRNLEDGNLEAAQALRLVEQGLEAFPGFAPFYLIQGDLHRDRSEHEKAILTYRRGLELVNEPDLESRILCALAGLLPADESERKQLVTRAVSLKGSLVANATATIMQWKT